MRPCLVLVASLAATATAAPTWPGLRLGAASDYFSRVATRVKSVRPADGPPRCDLSGAVMPTIAGMPPPASGSRLRRVVVGRGTQNYTCDGRGADAAPRAVGAVATLFDVSCVASAYPGVASLIPGVAVLWGLDAEERLGPAVLPVAGRHYFTAAGVPFFDLGDEGRLPCAKNASVDAPSTAAVGPGGEPAVAWLRLLATKDATKGLSEVFRVSTAGGSAPATCRDLEGSFQVQYSAEYWFWSK